LLGDLVPDAEHASLGGGTGHARTLMHTLLDAVDGVRAGRDGGGGGGDDDDMSIAERVIAYGAGAIARAWGDARTAGARRRCTVRRRRAPHKCPLPPRAEAGRILRLQRAMSRVQAVFGLEALGARASTSERACGGRCTRTRVHVRETRRVVLVRSQRRRWRSRWRSHVAAAAPVNFTYAARPS
jgi:hypothetical protein